MPKTKDAFALRSLSDLLESIIGKYTRIPIEWGIADDETLPLTIALFDMGEWISPSPFVLGKNRFEQCKSDIKNLFKRIGRTMDFAHLIERHLQRIRKYLLTVTKEISQIDSEQELKQIRKLKENRMKAIELQMKYEWLADIFRSYLEYERENLSNAQKRLSTEYKALFTERLKLARKKMNLRQKDVATELGITPTAYSNYERGARDLPPYTIYRLTQILSVSADYLFGLEN